MAIRKCERKFVKEQMEEVTGKIMRTSLEVSGKIAPMVLESMGKMGINTGDINRQEEFKHE